MSALGLEVAADSVASALAAQEGGAMRVELCGGLDGGGLTPSFGTLAVVRERLRIPLYVLIRPRVGDFVFDAAEVEVMRRDVEQCVRLGCDGVVLGALDRHGQVDLTTMRVLIEAAGSLGVTFHRAIDVSADPSRVLEDAVALGCERVLTSGGRATAIDGIDTIAAWCDRPVTGSASCRVQACRKVTCWRCGPTPVRTSFTRRHVGRLQRRCMRRTPTSATWAATISVPMWRACGESWGCCGKIEMRTTCRDS